MRSARCSLHSACNPSLLLANHVVGNDGFQRHNKLTVTLRDRREAIRIMRTQPAAAKPVYHIFNMGFSSWGAKVVGGPVLSWSASCSGYSCPDSSMAPATSLQEQQRSYPCIRPDNENDDNAQRSGRSACN